MKKQVPYSLLKIIFLPLAFILITNYLQADSSSVATYLSPRSASVNASRVLSGWEFLTHLNSCSNYLVTDLNPLVSYSFRANRISDCLFGAWLFDCKNRFEVAGSQIVNRSPQALLADDYGLPADYLSMIQLHPSVTNVEITFDAFIALNRLARGLYVSLHLPLVYTRWHFQACEDICQTGTAPPTGVSQTILNCSFIDYTMGSAPHLTESAFDPLCNAKFACGSLRKTALAEGVVAIGYDFLLSDWYHLGAQLQFAVPFGTRPESIFLFEPIVGNGHHWEAGGGISGHVIFYENEVGDVQIGIFGIGLFTHQFAAQQRRTFDLCERPLSRYRLVQELNESPAQGAQPVVPVANLTTLQVTVDAALQYDIAVAVALQEHQWSWTLGFGAWGRSSERIKTEEHPFSNRVWVLQEDTQPTILSDADIDFTSGAHGNSVNKLFGQVTHYHDYRYGTFYVGFGGQVEFGGSTNHSHRQKKECINCALSQWSIWLKSGITFGNT